MSKIRPEWLMPIKTNQKTANVRSDFLCLAVGVHTAPATVITNPAKSTVLGPPSQLSRGTIARQAIAPPVKSAPYNRGIWFDSRANTTENARPVTKNGIAEVK